MIQLNDVHIQNNVLRRKLLIINFEFCIKKAGLFNISLWDKWIYIYIYIYIYIFVFNSSFEVCNYAQWFFDVARNETSNIKYILELIKRRPKVHEKNISREWALNFDQR